MFCPDGYITLYEIAMDLNEHARFNLPSCGDQANSLHGFNNGPAPHSQARFWIDTGPPADEVEAYSKWLLFAFLELHGKEAKVALPTGSVVKIPIWLTRPDWSPFESQEWFDFNLYCAFPDIREERIFHLKNHLEYLDEEALTIDSEKTELRAVSIGLKPLHGFPLCFPEGLFPTGYKLAEHVETELSARLLGGKANSPNAKGHPLVPKVIALRETERLNKAEMKARLGKQCSAAEWNEVWKEAGLQRPDLRLSTPGPIVTPKS